MITKFFECKLTEGTGFVGRLRSGCNWWNCVGSHDASDEMEGRT